MRLWPWGRNPLSAKGSGLYHGHMADIKLAQYLRTEADTCTITVAEHRDGWWVRLWYPGRTINTRLKPTLLAERRIPDDRIPVNLTWEILLREVALAIEDMRGRTTDELG